MDRLIEKGVGPEFLLSEANGYRSRENIVIAASQALLAGAILAAIPNGDPVVAPGTPIGAGNGAIGAWTADAGAPRGRWWLTITGAAGATPTFAVDRPDGVRDGVGVVGSAYNGGINGTLADGATDWATGTQIPFDVAYDEPGEAWVKHDPEGTNGSQFVAGVLYDAVTTGEGETADAVAIVRDAEVIFARLAFDDHDTAEKAAVVAALNARGVVVRT